MMTNRLPRHPRPRPLDRPGRLSARDRLDLALTRTERAHLDELVRVVLR
ncbi:MAG: hypothetical protein PGN07_02245 [Aeromicrobium erythreum]